MAVNKLLVAFDESEGADRALAMAASLAAVNPEAHVDVVYVVPIPLLDETQMANFKDILDMMISDGEDLLAEAEQKMGEDVAARTDSLLLTGTNPATEIVKLIGQRDYDLLIVGNRSAKPTAERARTSKATDSTARRLRSCLARFRPPFRRSSRRCRPGRTRACNPG